jgi:hypothetical protein
LSRRYDALSGARRRGRRVAWRAKKRALPNGKAIALGNYQHPPAGAMALSRCSHLLFACQRFPGFAGFAILARRKKSL